MTETSTTSSTRFGIAVDDLRIGHTVLYPHQTREGTHPRKVTVTLIVEYPANRVLYFRGAQGPGVVDRRVVLQIPCSWGLHDEPAVGRTPAGVPVCATCAPLAGLAVSS